MNTAAQSAMHGLFSGYPHGARLTIAVVATLAVAYLCAELVSQVIARVVDRAHHRDPRDAAHRTATRTSLRVVRAIVTCLVAIVLIFPAVSMVGIRPRVGLTPERLADWLTGSGLRIALIVLLSWVVVHVVGIVARRLEASIGTAITVDVIERAKRARTLGTLIQNTVYVLVSTIALLMILRELNVDITPILTGAGIVGLAVGFGAQSLVKDIISGFFLILEDQIRVGDVANIDGTGGLVERITLRTIILRDEAGTVHVIPNGSIQRLSNLTKDFSYYVSSIGVGIREDTDRVARVLTEVADGLMQDPAFAPFMLGPLEVLGVDRFNDAGADVKVRLKTVPIKQWVVGREFLRRVKQAFEKNNISLTTTNRTILLDARPALLPDDDAAPPGTPQA